MSLLRRRMMMLQKSNPEPEPIDPTLIVFGNVNPSYHPSQGDYGFLCAMNGVTNEYYQDGAQYYVYDTGDGWNYEILCNGETAGRTPTDFTRTALTSGIMSEVNSLIDSKDSTAQTLALSSSVVANEPIFDVKSTTINGVEKYALAHKTQVGVVDETYIPYGGATYGFAMTSGGTTTQYYSNYPFYIFKQSASAFRIMAAADISSDKGSVSTWSNWSMSYVDSNISKQSQLYFSQAVIDTIISNHPIYLVKQANSQNYFYESQVFPTLDVRNVSVWTASVTDDAREVGFTLEKPYHLEFSAPWQGAQPHLLTDADFLCMDVPDDSKTIMTDRYLYIPAIGKWDMAALSKGQTVDITTTEVVNGYHGSLTSKDNYYFTTVSDSKFRLWYKMKIQGMELNGNYHKHAFARSSDLHIYYCTEEKLGDMFPSRIWGDKKYMTLDMFIDSGRNYSYRNNVFNGLVLHNTRSAVLQRTPNNAPAYYDGALEGYLLEIPSGTEQINIRYASAGGWSGFLDSNLSTISISGSGWANDNTTITVTSEMKYMVFQVGSLDEDIGLRIFFIMDWGT